MKVEHLMIIVVVIICVMIAIVAMFTIPIGIFPPEVYEQPKPITTNPLTLLVIAIIGIVGTLYLNYSYKKDEEEKEK